MKETEKNSTVAKKIRKNFVIIKLIINFAKKKFLTLVNKLTYKRLKD